MNQKLHVLLAGALTVLTLSACSTPAATTTAGTTTPSTTAAVTLPTTTTPVTTPSTTAAATTTPATMPPATTTAGQPVTHTSDIANVYIRSAEAMANLNSFRVTTQSESELLGQKFETKTVMDMFPKEKKSKISSDFAGQTTEMYLMDDKMYLKGQDGSWMYFVADDVHEVGAESVEQAKTVTDAEYADMFTYEKSSTGHKIKTKRPLTLADFEKLGNRPDAATPDPLGGDIPLDVTYEMEMEMNNEYYTTETKMTITTTTDGVKTVSDMEMKYSDFNQVPAITLPAEALNAKEFTIPGMPSTKP